MFVILIQYPLLSCFSLGTLEKQQLQRLFLARKEGPEEGHRLPGQVKLVRKEPARGVYGAA